MRIPRSIAVAIGTVLITAVPATLYPQCREQVTVQMETMSVIYPDTGPVVPFTLTFKTTHVDKLANGVTNTYEFYERLARDSSGREYRKSKIMRDHGYFVTQVNDPLDHTSLSWFSNSNEAFIVHNDPAAPQLPQPGSPANVPWLVPCPQIADLGTRTIQGITTNGKRITQTIKVRSNGNDQLFTPFTVTTDMWYSPELHRYLLLVSDDPESTVTTEATDVERGEPDPYLFQIPEGYTIKDIYPQDLVKR